MTRTIYNGRMKAGHSLTLAQRRARYRVRESLPLRIMPGWAWAALTVLTVPWLIGGLLGRHFAGT